MKNKPKPHVKLFVVDSGTYYIYDVGSNQILNVDKIIYEFVQQWQNSDYLSAIQSIGAHYPNEIVASSLKEVDICMRQMHVLNKKKIYRLTNPEGMTSLSENLTNKVGHLILELTQSCNLRCEYCKHCGTYPMERTHRNIDMSQTIAFGAIDFARNHSTHFEGKNLSVGFYGGEPLLRFELLKKTVDYAKSILDKEVHFSITTNGTIMNDQILDFLISEKMSVQISLDGPQNIHDRYRKTINLQGSHSEIISNLRKILERDEKYYHNYIGFNIVFSPPFLLEQVRQYYQHEPLVRQQQFAFSTVDPYDTSFYNRFDQTQVWQEYNSAIDRIGEDFITMSTESPPHFDNFAWQYFCTILHRIHRRPIASMPNELYPNGICTPGLQRLYIDATGAFYPCERCTHYKIGDLGKGFDLKAIEVLVNEYLEISSECLSCWAVRLCSSCYVSAFRGDRLDSQKKHRNCENFRASMELFLKIYCRMMALSASSCDELFTGQMTDQNYF